MEREMININGNLVGEIKTTTIDTNEGKREVANFTVVNKFKENGKTKKRIYLLQSIRRKSRDSRGFRKR